MSKRRMKVNTDVRRRAFEESVWSKRHYMSKGRKVECLDRTIVGRDARTSAKIQQYIYAVKERDETGIDDIEVGMRLSKDPFVEFCSFQYSPFKDTIQSDEMMGSFLTFRIGCIMESKE